MPLIDPGKKAPAFTLKDQDEQARSLKDYAGSPLVMFFYPKDATSGCTREACDFRDLGKDFEKAGPRCWACRSCRPRARRSSPTRRA
jgi:peroxiredoxin Q/BCP